MRNSPNFVKKTISLKTESLDNAIIELWLAWPSRYVRHYTKLSKYGNCTRLLKILQIKSGRIIDILWLSTISYPTRTRGIIVNYLTLMMDLFYQPSSICMEHAGLLSSTDTAIYTFKNFAIHQLVQHQPGFRVQHLFLKKTLQQKQSARLEKFVKCSNANQTE